MKKETDIEALRRTAIGFLYQNITETEFPFIVIHPIFSMSNYYSRKSEKFINLLEEKDLLIAQKELTEQINNSDLTGLFILIRDPYKLTFLKYAKDDMSLKDFSNYFAHAWVTAENPNMDVNCSLRYLVSCFRYCDKKELMVEEDYQFFQQLPDEVRVYRGVTPGHNPKGLSWTLNYEKAAWFSRRFETENEKGYILTAIANKKDILAYFNTRNEDEVVCDTKKLINIERCDK